jgi:hypothetical protein
VVGHRLRVSFLACLVLLGATLLPLSAKLTPIVEYAPDPTQKGISELRGATWVSEGPGYSMRLQLINDEQRLAYIEHSTGLTIDPFAPRRGDPPRYITFVLEIENSAEIDLLFNPRQSWLMTNRKVTSRKDIQTPLMMSDLSFQYRQAGRELPPAYERVSRALFENTVSVAPGRSTSGLLIYRAIDLKNNAYRVDTRIVTGTGEVVKLLATYKKVKPKKK